MIISRLKVPGSTAELALVYEALFGGDEYPHSQLELAPGDIVKVRFAFGRAKLQPPGTGQSEAGIKLEAVVEFSKFEDGSAEELMMQGLSQRITSANTITVTVGPPQ